METLLDYNSSLRPSTAGPIKVQARFRNFVFTLNNYTEEEEEQIHSTLATCKWGICGREVAPTTGTPHLQGACVIGAQKVKSTILKWPGFKRAYIAPMYGTPEDSLKYCSKSKNFKTFGVLPAPGKRNDLITTVQQLRDGKTIRELVETDEGAVTFIKYHKGITLLHSYLRSGTELDYKKKTVIWIWGATGTNKTKSAIQIAKNYNKSGCWISNGNLKWFDGYTGQDFAIFDDYRTSHCQFSYLLRLLDGYPLRIEIKGSYVDWIPSTIFITAPDGPRTMWNLKTQEQLDQLCRRITHTFGAPEELEELYNLYPLRVNNTQLVLQQSSESDNGSQHSSTNSGNVVPSSQNQVTRGGTIIWESSEECDNDDNN